MRLRQIGALVVLALGLACRSPSSVPEQGSVLLRVRCAFDTPVPDELRVWAYDERGVLWDGARVPPEGYRLVSNSAAELGTVLVAPGTIQGALRIHVRAMVGGQRLADGMLSIPSLAGKGKTYDVRLETTVPADSDEDGVPDAIDDCLGVANPRQGGCSAAPTSDAGGKLADADDSKRDVRATDGGQLSDTNATVVVDPGTQIDAMREPQDSPVLTPDTFVRSGNEVGKLDSGTVPTADTRAPDDVAVTGRDTNAPMDLATTLDTRLVMDMVLDAKSSDTPEGDACVLNCKKAQGERCSNNDECASSFCADGVCCTNSCVGTCRSCSQPDSTGICKGYTQGTDPESECTSGAKCNGAGACGSSPPPSKANGQLCGTGSECQSGFCSDGVCCNEACNQACQKCGSGTCESVVKTDDIPECSGTMTCNAKGRCVGSTGG